MNITFGKEKLYDLDTRDVLEFILHLSSSTNPQIHRGHHISIDRVTTWDYNEKNVVVTIEFTLLEFRRQYEYRCMRGRNWECSNIGISLNFIKV